MTNVPAPDPWAEIAAELHRIAGDAEKLIGQPAPTWFEMNIQPQSADGYQADTVKNRAATTGAVDAVAIAFLGKSGATVKMGSGTFHHVARGTRGRVGFAIYQSVADPDLLLDQDDELVRLRARVAELEADRTGLNYTRADDDTADPTPPGPRVAPHFESGTDERPVDETEPTCPPECAQNWTRASDPLVHVDHCPKSRPGRAS